MLVRQKLIEFCDCVLVFGCIFSFYVFVKSVILAIVQVLFKSPKNIQEK